MAADAASTDGHTVVLIHGMWMTPLSWEHWADRFRGQGHEVIAPAWPGLDREPEELRRTIPARTAGRRSRTPRSRGRFST
jgi:alpha-beta hydrolase superfamily lysophospholipase